MAVYVDTMEAAFQPKHRPGRRYIMSHMIADTEEELHHMARRIGVARKWYQNRASFPHYDIAQTKKALALQYGAKEVSTRELVQIAKRLRAAG